MAQSEPPLQRGDQSTRDTEKEAVSNYRGSTNSVRGRVHDVVGI